MAARTITLLFLWLASTAACAADQTDEHNALFLRGTDLIRPYLVLAGSKQVDPTTVRARTQMIEGIRLLRKVIDMNPENWSALWFIGKAHQALQDHDAAYLAFREAFEINSTQPDVARELTLECLCIGKTSEAVVVAEVADWHRPNDPGLRANLGLALLADRQLSRARTVTQSAVKLAPDDPITKNVLADIEAISKGRPMRLERYCPH